MTSAGPAPSPTLHAELPFDRPAQVGNDPERRVVEMLLPGTGTGLADLALRLAMPTERVVLAAWLIVLATYSRRSCVKTAVALQGELIEIDIDADRAISFSKLGERISAAIELRAVPSAVGPSVFVLDLPGGSMADAPADTSLVVGCTTRRDGVTLIATYDPGRFDQATATRILDHLATVLVAV